MPEDKKLIKQSSVGADLVMEVAKMPTVYLPTMAAVFAAYLAASLGSPSVDADVAADQLKVHEMKKMKDKVYHRRRLKGGPITVVEEAKPKKRRFL